MNTENIAVLAKELATFVNKLVNVPFVSEEEEQFVFELVILKALQLFTSQLEEIL
ncbi:MAG TPA: hypothetical protein PL124_05770 [Candidatus Cloacimonadota bacterium]|nr:hypothetical protein [Candidatus Cloacimonadota bacterium]HPS38905.1 hypothetical protein [Candidatus Cloacimonadota bacterium]